MFLVGLTSRRYSRYFWGLSPFALAVSRSEYTIMLASALNVVSLNSQLRLSTVTGRMVFSAAYALARRNPMRICEGERFVLKKQME